MTSVFLHRALVPGRLHGSAAPAVPPGPSARAVHGDLGLPKMPAPTQGLAPETRRAEGNHADLKRKIEALTSHYDNQTRLATLDLRQKTKAAYAEFERQHADIASQLAKSLRGSVEAVLRQKLELEIDALQRAHREQEEARTRAYNEQRQKYEHAIFTSIDALIFAGVSLAARTDRFSLSLSLVFDH